ncbi:MAG TPA: hypothetical protein DCX53_06830 [Anaerolineae bacterium]|nr:hypothetical protein [Anaerolineae bacterium]
MLQVDVLLTALLNDKVMFSVLQIMFVVLLFFGLIKEAGWFRRKSNLAISVKRGEKSWNYFHLFYGFMLLIIIEIISFTDAFTGYKTFIGLVDIAILTYLSFFNGWFRNKIMGFIVASQRKDE